MFTDDAVQVDVVIPCFNAARYLAEAIDSVFDQGVCGTRIILVDDGSTDNSVAIAESYGSRLTVHRQPNAGIAAARNAGVRLARAPWLAFLDADDVWTAGGLAARMAHFGAEPDTDLVFARLEQFHSPDLDEASRRRMPFDDRPADARFAGTLLARRESFLRAGPFDPSFRVGEMIEWIARAQSQRLKIATIDKVVLRRRIHGRNTVLQHGQDKQAYLRALKSALDRKRTASPP